MKRTRPRLASAILLAIFLTACAKDAPSRQTPPAVPTVIAPIPTPAPLVLPDPGPFRVQPQLLVRTAKSVRVYTGRGSFYLPITDLAGGTVVEYLDSREGWLLIRTRSGETGWIPGADAVIGDGRNQAIAYIINPGRWEIQTNSGPQIQSARAGAGVLRVVISGLVGEAKTQSMSDGSLLLSGISLNGLQSAVDIGDSGLARISLSERGLLLELENHPVHRIVSNEGDSITLEIRPGLERVERTATGWTFQARGDLRPVIRAEGGGLVIDLPGALLATGFPVTPAGLTMTEVGPEAGATTGSQANMVTATVPTRMALGGLRLQLPRDTGPYALYRPEPGRIELRFMAVGIAGKTILLDPGHGGEESGAVGGAGHLEKNVNLAVSLLLRSLLQGSGARVLMTRTEDARVLSPSLASTLGSFSERTQADLAARSDQANRANADLVVSVHANAGPAGDGGTETFWAISNLNAARSQHLAQLMQSELIVALGLYNRGVKQRPFNVIRMSYAPAVLVELGFMSNSREERLLASRDGQEAAAQALFRAIQAYFAG